MDCRGATYDAAGQLIREEHDLDGHRFEFEQTYDLLGQPKLRTFPLAGATPVAQLENQYAAAGYLTTHARRSGTLAQSRKQDGWRKVVQ